VFTGWDKFLAWAKQCEGLLEVVCLRRGSSMCKVQLRGLRVDLAKNTEAGPWQAWCCEAWAVRRILVG
jgi:hypothetical protein